VLQLVLQLVLVLVLAVLSPSHHPFLPQG
jgi:hypothetical protein